MIEEHGEDFNEGNVTTAFVELAKVVESGEDKENVHINETFQTLVGEALSLRSLPAWARQL